MSETLSTIRAEIKSTLRLFHRPGECIEICIISPASATGPWTGRAFGRKAIVAGWFDDLGKAAELVARVDKQGAAGIYHVLNPVNPALLGRACNRLEAGVSRTADKDIVTLRWLLIDCDPVRPEGVSSTDAEHTAALEVAGKIRSDLTREGWPEPILADSGNGAHVIYQLPDLPNTPENVLILQDTLQALAKRYDTEQIKIDLKCFNPSRLCKVHGTTAAKGDALPDRPHRRSRILDKTGGNSHQ